MKASESKARLKNGCHICPRNDDRHEGNGRSTYLRNTWKLQSMTLHKKWPRWMTPASRRARPPGPLPETGRAGGRLKARCGEHEGRFLHVPCPSLIRARHVQELPLPPRSCEPSTWSTRDYLVHTRGTFAVCMTGRPCPACKLRAPRVPPRNVRPEENPMVNTWTGNPVAGRLLLALRSPRPVLRPRVDFASRVANRRSKPPSTHARSTRM